MLEVVSVLIFILQAKDKLYMVLQAKSPFRTLDELNVSEVVSTPYFPSLMERRHTSLSQEDRTDASLNNMRSSSRVSSDDRLTCPNGGTLTNFGMRRGHRCFVITARARSFLYHQVGVVALSPSYIYMCVCVCNWFWGVFFSSVVV